MVHVLKSSLLTEASLLTTEQELALENLALRQQLDNQRNAGTDQNENQVRKEKHD